MATIKVHGVCVSAPVRRVLLCLYEKGLDFELVPVDYRTAENKKEPFLSLNPFGQLPAFEHGDVIMFESRAINYYLAQEYADKGTQLIRTSGKEMAEMLVWMEVESLHFGSVFRIFSRERVFNPLKGLPTDTAVLEESKAKLSNILDVYEARLGRSKYLGGDTFTLADLHHIPTIASMMKATDWKELLDSDSRPHVRAWIADITARPAWAKVLALKKDQK
ncbi:hypothetical protein Tsubulata_041072 [Turnera subulata]|uniref:glutathione transferase n=1 Tax=Turnera subulata TaxID=218843 RepID=A0A9Q0JBM1_9ROSI|nr:hypothetical protein Tsubulata_041072 [Turnera subulata]